MDRIYMVDVHRNDDGTRTRERDESPRTLADAMAAVAARMLSEGPSTWAIDVRCVLTSPPPGPKPITDIAFRVERFGAEWEVSRGRRYVA